MTPQHPIIRNSAVGLTSLAILGIASLGFAQTPGRLIALHAGAEVLSVNGNSLEFRQLSKTGGSQTPTTLFNLGTAASTGICFNGQIETEGALSRTLSGRYLGFVGYDGPIGTSERSAAASTTVNRIIGRLDFTGTTNLSTRLNNAFSSGSIRSMVWTDRPVSDGTNLRYRAFAVGGNEGVRSANFGTTSSALNSSTSTDNQNIVVSNSNLYFSTAAGTPGIRRIASLPTGTATATNLINTTGINPYGFIFVGDVAGNISCYVTDDVEGIVKYTSTTGINGTYTRAYVVSSVKARQLCTDGRAIYAVTNGGPLYTQNQLVVIWDGGSAGASFSQALTSTTPNSAGYRGIELAPEPIVVDNSYTSAGTAGNIMTLRSSDGAQRTLRVGLIPDADHRTWTNLASINYSGQAVKTTTDSSGNTYVLIQDTASSGSSVVPTISIRRVPVGGGSAVSSSVVNIPAGFEAFDMTIDASGRPVVAYRPSSGTQNVRFVRWTADLSTGTVSDNSGAGFSSGSKTPVSVSTDPNNYLNVMFATGSTLSTTAFSSTFVASSATTDLSVANDGANSLAPIAAKFGADGSLRVLSVGSSSATRNLFRVDTLASGNTTVATTGTSYRRDATGTTSGSAVSPAFFRAEGLAMDGDSPKVLMVGIAEPTTGPSGPGVGTANRNDNIFGSGRVWSFNTSNVVSSSTYRFAPGFTPVN